MDASRLTLVGSARSEKAIMAWPARMIGGELTVDNQTLVWERSSWSVPLNLARVGPLLALIMDKRPKELRLNVQDIAVGSAGRMIPWAYVVLMAISWWGIISVPISFLTGWSRRCVAVHSFRDGKTYYFAVREVEEWLTELAALGARKAILS